MSSQKEHHYVPQFYLRRFSTDKEQKLIGLYHLKSNFLFYKAPIRKQAKEKNYYGQTNAVEKILSIIEFDASVVLTDIIQKQEIPSIKSSAYLKLMYFVMFQERRTKRAEIGTNQQLDMLQEASYAKFGQKPPREPKIPINQILLTAVKSIRMCDYLQFQLLINNTETPFITSDNPVVMNNLLMETLELSSASGWATKGLQVFYPISPKHMLIWNDPFVYRSGGKTKRAVITTSIESDINQLNALQFLNSQDQIFFNSDFSKSRVHSLINKWTSTKLSAKPKTWGAGSFTFVVGVEFNVGINLSFVKINQQGKNFRPYGRLVYLRHPDLEKERSKRE